MLTETSGTYDAIDSFMPRVTDEGAIKALENLKEILDILDGYGFLKYVTVDLGLMEDARYYTGVVFKGYTYEVGFPIIGGGRYDNISKTFGADLSAVGFSISLTLAITALMRQDKFTPVAGAQVIVGGDFAIAAATAETLRSEGTAAVLDTTGMTEDELNEYAEKKGIATVMYMNGGEA
jgi:ATP phosphoribosyltransferase regulatory subunit